MDSETATRFQSLTKGRAFNPVASPRIVDALEDLLGPPLVTFPEQTTWDLPTTQWQLDFRARGKSDVLPGVRVLAFIAEGRPRSGGAVVAEGTHRLVEQLVDAGEVPGRPFRRGPRHAVSKVRAPGSQTSPSTLWYSWFSAQRLPVKLRKSIRWPAFGRDPIAVKCS